MGTVTPFRIPKPSPFTILCPICSAPMRGQTLIEAFDRMEQHIQAQHAPLVTNRLTLAEVNHDAYV